MNTRKRKRNADSHLLPISKHPRQAMDSVDDGIFSRWKSLGLDAKSLAYETMWALIPEIFFGNISATTTKTEPISTSDIIIHSLPPPPNHAPLTDQNSNTAGRTPLPLTSNSSTNSSQYQIPLNQHDKRQWSQQTLRVSPSTSFRKSPKNKTKASSSSNWPKPPTLRSETSHASTPRPPHRNTQLSTSIGSLGSRLAELTLDSQSDAASSSNPIPPTYPAGYVPSPTLDALLAQSPPLQPRQKPQPRKYKQRPHIYHRVHQAYVEASHKELRDDMRQKYFAFKQKKGYESSYKTFLGFVQYEQYLHGKVESSPQKDPSPRDEDEWLVHRLEKVSATLKEPKPQMPKTPNIQKIYRGHRAKDEAIELRLRPPRPTLPSTLPPQDEQKVHNFLRKHGVISKFSREQVTDQDVHRLRPGQWLNDEIINFYGAMIMARSDAYKENLGKGKEGTPLKTFYMSTFFWSKLIKEGYEKGRLAKWTKKVDIFSKDVILIPVNHSNAHWTAAAINFRKKRFESYDSMGMAKEQVFQNLRLYVDAEHQNKKNSPFNFKGWENWAPDETPQQENGYDCGVFTCQFLEALSRGEDDFIFSQKDMPYLRRRMILEIGNAALHGDI